MERWGDLSNMLEDTVDEQFGEAIIVSPYKKAQFLTEWIPDPSRSTRRTIGYRVSKYASIRSAGPQAQSFVTKRTEADLLVQVRESYIPDTRQNDRVTLRGTHYDISFIELWGNGRNVLHLLRRKD